ncbi:adenylosuccinase ade13 [Podospora pseudocomata]|uniref:Adenylosuccinate lyase n=2 Tax=Podospora TaxID=5144 RepID=A0ABR0H0M6_9PEZI|nr:adenylosuccinase ade13 [Podospora pseudocomata]KAK4661439.1 adenylosuccinase ade13 [Podospora pseudopauciseta]
MSSYDKYVTPLSTRYASQEMMTIFSARERASTWRQLWVWLAEAERELGLPIPEDAIQEMRENVRVSDEAFDKAREYEAKFRHDVMAHVHAYGEDAPKAAGHIHLGATSCYVTDNADLIFQKKALDLILPKLAKVIQNLQVFALKYKDLPTLGFTHYQPAQLITVGKRAAQWIQELMMDLEDIETVRDRLQFRGAQGTTGSQATFLELFEGNADKIVQLNEILCKKAGFPSAYPISTQTYTRKVDLRVANAVCALGATAQRICSDIRHLANLKEMEEPFEKSQIGSSAMAYKRNPMRSERITALGRKLARLPADFTATFETQWFERTLDDSAIRRMDIPEMFLLADSILLALDNVTNGIVLYPSVIRSRIDQELPFMATESILMKLATHGVSRQEAHEEVRVLSHQASDVVKQQGGRNDLLERIKKTEFFRPVWGDIDSLVDPKLFIGNCPKIVEDYCNGEVAAKLANYKESLDKASTAQLSI